MRENPIERKMEREKTGDNEGEGEEGQTGREKDRLKI